MKTYAIKMARELRSKQKCERFEIQHDFGWCVFKCERLDQSLNIRSVGCAIMFETRQIGTSG